MLWRDDFVELKGAIVLAPSLVWVVDQASKNKWFSPYYPHVKKALAFLQGLLSLVTTGAEDEIRTRDPHLGKVMLYH